MTEISESLCATKEFTVFYLKKKSEISCSHKLNIKGPNLI